MGKTMSLHTYTHMECIFLKPWHTCMPSAPLNAHLLGYGLGVVLNNAHLLGYGLGALNNAHLLGYGLGALNNGRYINVHVHR